MKKIFSQKTGDDKTLLLQHINIFLKDVFLANNLTNPRIVVAFSGGLDSFILLHLLANINNISSHTLPFQLSAHHVHHGLSPHADSWANFCQSSCNQLNIALTISKVYIDSNSGLGIEATARKARYAALMASDADFICTAHHQDDQAETLLLQLARGAGIKGLSGMAQIDCKRKLLRPLLNTSKADLEAYAKYHQLHWVDDESNADIQFSRNFMRHKVLPILAKQYPVIKQNLARTAQHLAEASSLLDALAEKDAQIHSAQHAEILSLQPLASLSQARINNVMRWWLAQNQIVMPSAAQLKQITQQLFHAKSDAMVKIKLDDDFANKQLTLRRFQNSAYLVTELNEYALMDFIWQGETELFLPNKTSLKFEQKIGEGLAIRHLTHHQLHIKSRVGSERFKPDLKRPSRSLKVVLQTAKIPPWQRTQLPLIVINDIVVVMPNIAVDAHFKAAADEIGLVVTWHFA